MWPLSMSAVHRTAWQRSRRFSLWVAFFSSAHTHLTRKRLPGPPGFDNSGPGFPVLWDCYKQGLPERKPHNCRQFYQSHSGVNRWDIERSGGIESNPGRTPCDGYKRRTHRCSKRLIKRIITRSFARNPIQQLQGSKPYWIKLQQKIQAHWKPIQKKLLMFRLSKASMTAVSSIACTARNELLIF